MLTAEIKVNGALIGHVYIHNEGYLGADTNVCGYTYHIYDVGEAAIVKEGHVEHDRSDGAFALINRVLDALPYKPQSKFKRK